MALVEMLGSNLQHLKVFIPCFVDVLGALVSIHQNSLMVIPIMAAGNQIALVKLLL
jgi:hypothetical protein